jgi:hypothetical protein
MTTLLCWAQTGQGAIDVVHRLGLPADGPEAGTRLPRATYAVLVLRSDGVFLERFAPNGDFLGDTWHRDPGEAKRQAEVEFGIFLADWKDAPADVDDPEELIRRVRNAE